MKICPQCSKEFGDEYNFCPDDGTPLAKIVPLPLCVVDPDWNRPGAETPDAYRDCSVKIYLAWSQP